MELKLELELEQELEIKLELELELKLELKPELKLELELQLTLKLNWNYIRIVALFIISSQKVKFKVTFNIQNFVIKSSSITTFWANLKQIRLAYIKLGLLKKSSWCSYKEVIISAI